MQKIRIWDFRYGEVSSVCWEDCMAVDKGNHLEDDVKLILGIDLLMKTWTEFHIEGQNASYTIQVPLHLQFERLVQDLARNVKH